MVKNILVFVPNTFKLNKSGYLEGVRKETEDCDSYYVTSDSAVKETSDFIGYVSDDVTKLKIKDFHGIHIDPDGKLSLINSSSSFVKIEYDFKAFKNCGGLNPMIEYGAHFKFLSENLKKKRRLSSDNGHKSNTFRFLTLVSGILQRILFVLNNSKIIWSYSATLSHFYDTLNGFRWFCDDLIKEKRVSAKGGNFILSKIVDLVLGILLLKLFIRNESYILQFIEEARETIIHNFRDLLIYLMGSPIGLKLNYAFNKSLGTFFFYHISLWRFFLITMHPFVRQYFKFLVLPGAFGFSYQIAMLSDLISIATFHVYCIYVYAARLTYLQLKGLLSLWRLFIGRKYNPLRMRVDSHQYSQHQLFIGTLGFTILLFLLPTTAMYYTVFVAFRLAVLIAEDVLLKVRYLLQCLPIYVLILFAIKSPLLAGPVCLRCKKSKDGVSTFEARLKMLPLVGSLRSFAPDTIKTGTSMSWKKVLTGVLL